nr:immunoglobulin light chain junction region [Macaca mulatta]
DHYCAMWHSSASALF